MRSPCNTRRTLEGVDATRDVTARSPNDGRAPATVGSDRDAHREPPSGRARRRRARARRRPPSAAPLHAAAAASSTSSAAAPRARARSRSALPGKGSGEQSEALGPALRRPLGGQQRCAGQLGERRLRVGLHDGVGQLRARWRRRPRRSWRRRLNAWIEMPRPSIARLRRTASAWSAEPSSGRGGVGKTDDRRGPSRARARSSHARGPGVGQPESACPDRRRPARRRAPGRRPRRCGRRPRSRGRGAGPTAVRSPRRPTRPATVDTGDEGIPCRPRPSASGSAATGR